jgi:hypothetical protein
MAQLKDSIVQGNLRVTDTTLTDIIQTTTIRAPSTSGGAAYSAGSNGQVLTSNGTSTYWGAANNHTHSQYYASTTSRTANTVLAAPNGSNGAATFRKLVAADIPALDYSKVTSSSTNGNIKINGTETTVYTHPTYTSKSSGLYKITVDTKGHVSATAAVAASDLPAHTHSDYVLKAGDTMSGNLKMNATNKGFYLKDSAGNEYAGVYDNGTNLWLGALQTASTHHVGRTYISSGYDSANSVGYSSIYVSVPNADNTNASNYEVLHFGNISAEVTGSGNAVTSVSFANGKVTASKGSTFLTQHPTITKSADTTSTASPSHGGTFTCIDSVTRETNGHVTKINTKTVTLPAQYVHPTYTSKTSGLYKITVDGTGHVSATAAVAKGDIPALDYLPTTTKYALSDSVGGDALVAKHLKNIDLNSTNIDAAEGSFAFRGANDPFPDTDWVGLQIGDDRDKFQLITNGHDLAIRFNDTGGSDSTNWTDWSNIIDRRYVTPTPSAKIHSDWSTTSEREVLVTKGWMSYWDGSYSSAGNSNLTYCNRGAFGTIVTKSTTDYSKVSLSRSLTSGTKIGTITIDGTATDLYCETNTNTDTKVDQVLSSANEKHPLLIAKSQTSVTTATVNDTILRNNSIYVNPSTGALTATQIYGSGTENQSTAPTGGYHIYDCRSVTINPEHGHNAANFYFHQTGTPDTSKWWSILHMRGWTSGYSAWELAGPSHNSDQRTTPLYVRTSNGTTAWGSWRKIYDSSNKPTASDLGFGTIVTHNEGDYVLKAGDTMTGSLTLYSASGDSPALRFQRGTLTDNLNDWLIKDSGGHLKIQSNTTSTDTYFDALTINSESANITMKEDAVLHGKLAQYSTSRPTSANLTTKGDTSLQMLLSTSTMTSGKPAGDGYILNMDWDNTGKYQAQLFLPNSYSKVKPPQYRVQNASADWSDADCKWRNFITEDNYTDYTSRFGHVLDDSEDFASYPWHKIATTTITGNYTDHEATFLVQKTWSTYEQCVGILAVKIHTGSDYHFESGIFKWIFTGTGINTEDYVVVYTNGTNSCTVDIYVKITTCADGWRFNILSEGTRVVTAPMWDMIVTGSQHGVASLPAGTGHIVSSRWDAYIPLIGSTDVTGNIKITKTSGDTGYYASRSDTSITCWFGVASGGTNHGFYSNKINNWMFAANATNALVYHTLQNPSSETSYAISFGGNNTSTGVKERFVNNGLAYRTKEGTTSSAGVSTLILGNTTASGTAGNKSGRIRLYTTSTQYCDIIGYMSSTAYTVTIPPITGRATIQSKGTTGFYGLADGDGTQGWIRTTNYGFIPAAAGTMKSPHSSLGTATWVFNDAHVRDIYGSKLELGQSYTVDSSGIGGSIKMHGDGDETMDTVTLKPADVPGPDNYNITIPMMNGTMSLIDTIATTSSSVPAASTVSNCTIDSAVKFLTIVLKVNGESDEHYTIQVPKIIGVHYFPITIGAGPTTGGGSCVVTSGFIQITSGSSGKYNITAGRKTQTATMTSSGWSISSPSWTPLIVAVYGIK